MTKNKLKMKLFELRKITKSNMIIFLVFFHLFVLIFLAHELTVRRSTRKSIQINSTNPTKTECESFSPCRLAQLLEF